MLRALELEVVGLDAQASRLEVLVLDPATSPACAAIGPPQVAGLDPVERAVWRRDDGAPRELDLEAVELEAIRLVAVAYDPLETPIQVGCLDVRFEALERPELELEL